MPQANDRQSLTPRRIQLLRRWAAITVASAGLLNLLSAITPPNSKRFDLLLDFLPIEVAGASTGIVVGVGLVLLLLSRAVRRGRRRAHNLVVGMMAISIVLHLTKALDFEEAILASAALVFLIWGRRAFSIPGRPIGIVASSLTAVGGAVVTVVTALGVVYSLSPALSWNRALGAVIERLVFVDTTPLPGRLDHTMTAALHGLGVALVLVAIRAVMIPAVSAFENRHRFDRAAQLVNTYGADTLSYFSLRDDKRWYIDGEHLIAYGLFGDVCVISPDPVGPAEGIVESLSQFLDGVRSNGLTPVVLGASADWVPRYADLGFRSIYLGDEAIIDCASFTLEGRRMKNVREAVNRISRNGYRAEFFDPAHLPAGLRRQLHGLSGQSRQGESERGFSMTLGRLFDSRDRGLLLAVAFDSAGAPVAYCQFVPASLKSGFSLDVMRRDLGKHPNGLMDFLVAQTALHLRDGGAGFLGLNFAVMKGVLKSEVAPTGMVRLRRKLVEVMSRGTQIQTLYRFNDKFNPAWSSRYLMYETVSDLSAIAVAVARAESLWEIPIFGRLLKPRAV